MGGLRGWNKVINQLFLVLSLFLSCLSYGAEKESLRLGSTRALVETSKSNSLEFDRIQLQLDKDRLSAKSLVALYNWKLSGSLIGTFAENPQTSPFAPLANDTITGNISLERQDPSGFTPYFNAGTEDVEINFPSTAPLKFKTSFLEGGVRIDLFKALFMSNSLKSVLESSIRSEISDISKIVSERAFEKKVLSQHFQTLKSSDKVKILEVQCGEYRQLRSITKGRFEKKLILEKDFLLVEVLYEECRQDLSRARNEFLMDLQELIKESGLYTLNVFVDYRRIKFPDLRKRPSSRIENNYDLSLSQKVFEATRAKSASQKSNKLPEITFDFALKSSGLDSSIGRAFEDSLNGELLTEKFALNFSHQFGESPDKINVQQSFLDSLIEKNKLAQLMESLKRDAIKLKLNLNYYDQALKRLKRIEKMQRRKAAIFREDFDNGRVSIRDLVEAQIAYLSSMQKTLDIKEGRARAYLEAVDLSGESFEKFY